MRKEKKINNHGMTAIEMLVSFIIVSAIVVGLFDVVMNYRNKQQIESIYNSVVAYSNSLQKTIQDDLIKKHVNHVSNVQAQQIDFYLDNPQETTHLEIDCANGQIRYGSLDNVINYPIPEIADLTLSTDSKIDYIVGNVNLVRITIVLEHPNLENEHYTFQIVSPLNFTSA